VVNSWSTVNKLVNTSSIIFKFLFIDFRLPSFSAEQKRLLKGTADFLALNFYSVSFAEHHDLSSEENVTWGYFTDQEMKASRDPNWLKG